jgi:hypothetical protein
VTDEAKQEILDLIVWVLQRVVLLGSLALVIKEFTMSWQHTRTTLHRSTQPTHPPTKDSENGSA